MGFLLEYVKHPTQIGAIAPSTKKLAKKMVDEIDFKNCNCIVEYGPGTGVFTKEIIKRKNEKIPLVLIEQNEKFCNLLKKRYNDYQNVYIFNDSAENVNKIMKEMGYDKVDYIISGLPFTSFPKELTHNILNKTNEAIGNDGKFITFQYTLLKLKTFERYLNITNKKHVLANLPPAYVLTMKK